MSIHSRDTANIVVFWPFDELEFIPSNPAAIAIRNSNKQTNAGRNTISLLEVMNERIVILRIKIIAINRKSSIFGIDKVKLRGKK